MRVFGNRIQKIQIRLDTKPTPFPTFLEMLAPLAGKQLLVVVHNAGVNNIDAYDAELYYPDGRLASRDYVVFNLGGDHCRSQFGKIGI